MKWIIFSIGAIALATCAVVGVKYLSRSRHNPFFDPDTIDGGVVKRNNGEDFPKVIASTEITSFDCAFSLIAHADEIELERGVYTLKATLNDGVVEGSISWRNRAGGSGDGSFRVDPSFMARIQEVVAKYGFANYNGCTHTVSGLPDMYGARLDVRYASGESIYTYDNQNNYLPMDAMYELNSLFANQCK